MAAEPSYLIKLWNRGVDVGVGVETSVIVGMIGLILYRGKLWLDEQRQRQEIRIAAEEADRVRREEARNRLRRLVVERDTFLDAAKNAGNQLAQAQVWETYLEWLQSKELHHLPANLASVANLARWGDGLRGSTATSVEPNRRQMVAVMSRTELPPEE